MAFYFSSGSAMEDYNENTASNRIGRRIRFIREERGMTQTELGEAVGLNANRIQQYENGARNPKMDLCKKIADALEVEVSAFADPNIASYQGVLYAFFELEHLFDLRMKEVDGQICLCFGEGSDDIKVSMLNNYLKAWFDCRKKVEQDILASSSDNEKRQIIHEYHNWEWNFPFSLVEGVPTKSERSKADQAMKFIMEHLEDK